MTGARDLLDDALLFAVLAIALFVWRSDDAEMR
jgi:hypothetical protein